MEETTAGSNSEALDTSLAHSWILLDTNEPANPIDRDAGQKGVEEPATSQDIQIISDSNKSDSESDGISIISENEFYQTRNEDDSSMNSSDENTVDNCRILEPLELQSESLQLQRSLETFAGKKESTNSSNLSEEDDEKVNQSMTLNDNSNRQVHEHSFLDVRFYIDNTYIISFVCGILLAVIVSCISSKTKQSRILEEKKVEQTGQNMMRYDKFLNSHIQEFCEDIPESTDDTYDIFIEKCLKNLMKHLEMARKMKQTNESNSKKQEFDSENNNHEPNIVLNSNKKKLVKSREEYRKIQLKSYENEQLKFTRKRKMEIINKNKTENVESVHKQHRRNCQYYKENKKNNKFNTPDDPEDYPENELLDEKRELMSWKKHLMVFKKNLMKWQVNLERREKELSEKISDFSVYGKESYSKKNKIKEKYKKTDKCKMFKMKNDDRKNKRNLNQGVKTKRHGKSKNIKVSSQRKNESSNFNGHTITGDLWYMNLVQGRNDIRKKDEKARWWFDRANFRKNKRNKAYWYFQYMLNRENLRYDQYIR